MLGASQTALLGAASTQVSYDGFVERFRADGVSYWKFKNDGRDQWGTQAQEAAISGLPELNVDSIVNLDSDGKCIAWPGSSGVFAQAGHNSKHKTAEGTIVVTFQTDSLATKSTLVAADAHNALGGLALEVLTDGTPRCFLRTSTGLADLRGNAGDVQLNQAYTMVFKWGPGGTSMALWDDTGNPVRRATDPRGDGITTSTSPIRFGAWHTDVSHHDGPYGRVIWLKRRISDDEQAILARARTIVRGTGEYVTTPEAHGWSAGNTVTRNTAAFNAAIADAAANAGSSSTGRGVVELVQGKTYTVVSTNGRLNNQIPAIGLQSNVEVRTAGKPNRASGNQAIVQFESWSGKRGMHNQCIFRFQSISNVFLGWVTLDGNKNSIDSVSDLDYTNGGDGAIHNIRVATGTSNFTIKQVLSRFALTDGIAVNDKQGGPSPTAGLIEDSTFTRNRRQGYSGGKAGLERGGFDQIIWRRCTFSDTGDFPGDVPGQKPGDGVDMEPAQPDEHIVGMTFDDCDFTGNRGSKWHRGIETGSFDPGGGLYIDMKADLRKFKCVNCRSTNNRDSVVFVLWDGPNFSELEITDLVISGNTLSNALRFGAHGTPSPGVGTLTNTTIVNTNAPTINFAGDLAATGHSVTVWKGNSNPTVDTNGRATITVNDGFPS